MSSVIWFDFANEIHVCIQNSYLLQNVKQESMEVESEQGDVLGYPLLIRIWKCQRYIQLLKTWIIPSFAVLLSLFFFSLVLSHLSCNTKSDVKYCLD